MKTLLVVALSAILAAPAWAGDLGSSISKMRGGGGPKVKSEVPVVNLPPISVPLKNSSKHVYITLFAFAKNDEDLWKLCTYEPRVRDTFFTYFYKNRLRRAPSGQLDVYAAEKLLKDRLNRAMGKKLVTQIVVAEGEYGTRYAPEEPPPVLGAEKCSRLSFKAKKLQ